MSVTWLFTEHRRLAFGHRLYLTGNTPALGQWKKFIPMDWRFESWIVKVELEEGLPIQYKYVVSQYEGIRGWMTWDQGNNRLMCPTFRGSRKFILGSFNIRYENANDKGALAWINRKYTLLDRVYQSNCSILALQELMPSQYQFMKDSLPSYYSIIWHSRLPTPSEGLAMIYDNQQYTVKQQGFLPIGTYGQPSFGAFCPRIIVYMVLHDNDSQQIIVVINCHLDHVSPNARNQGAILCAQQAYKLADRYRTDCVFITGDFNCPQQSPQLSPLSQFPLRPLRDRRQKRWTFDTLDEQRKIIDHVFSMTPKAARFSVDEGKLCSDHRMIVVELD